MEIKPVKIQNKIVNLDKTAQMKMQNPPVLNPNQNRIVNNNPKVTKFFNDFNLMQINTVTALSPTDITILNTIQSNIRTKLRAMGAQPTP
jgi:hypothetical protein